MTLRDILEITATVLTIAVSSLALYGAFHGIKHGFFKKLHRLVHHHVLKLERENQEQK